MKTTESRDPTLQTIPVYDSFTHPEGTIPYLNQAQAIAVIIAGYGYFIAQPIGVWPFRAASPFLGAFAI
jgi:hypothetical protein